MACVTGTHCEVRSAEYIAAAVDNVNFNLGECAWVVLSIRLTASYTDREGAAAVTCNIIPVPKYSCERCCYAQLIKQ